jgi:IclR family transcriptional regulator, acetate operon repressor
LANAAQFFLFPLYRILSYRVPRCKAAKTAGEVRVEASMNRLVTNDKSQVQVIARAATILRALEEENAGLSLGQIAQRVNLARSTVQRIVSALEIEKLVIAATPNGRVRLGPTILRLAASVRSDFLALARPFIVKLSEELHETVDLSTVKKDHLVFIDQVIGPQRLRTVSAVGETFPLYCTANGKAYLAQLDDAKIEALLGRAFEPRTPKTITRLEVLLDELKAVRRNGVAYDREEHTLGICAVGVALHDPLGNAVAISVPVPTQRFQDRQAMIAERLKETKRAMVAHMNSAAA